MSMPMLLAGIFPCSNCNQRCQDAIDIVSMLCERFPPFNGHSCQTDQWYSKCCWMFCRLALPEHYVGPMGNRNGSLRPQNCRSLCKSWSQTHLSGRWSSAAGRRHGSNDSAWHDHRRPHRMATAAGRSETSAEHAVGLSNGRQPTAACCRCRRQNGGCCWHGQRQCLCEHCSGGASNAGS